MSRSAALIGPFAYLVLGLGLTTVLGPFEQVALTAWLIYGMLALSLSLVWGQAGIFSFGQSAFFGIGGYIFGVVGLNVAPITHETLSALLCATFAAAGLAAVLGWFMFYGRVSDVYVAIITLAVMLVLLAVFTSTSGPQYRIGQARLGGYNGMTGIPGIAVPGSGELDRSGMYVFVILLSGAVFLGAQVLRTLPFGRVLVALRENELRTELLGFDVRAYRLGVFSLGGAIAGLAGACYAAWGSFQNPGPFTLATAAVVVIWVMVGGRTSLAGAFVGAIAVNALQAYLGGGPLKAQTPLALGAILLAVVLALPRGIAPLLGGVLARTRFGMLGARRLAVLEPAAPAPPGLGTTEREPPGRVAVASLGKRFGGVIALDEVTLTFEPGGLYCVIGPNGAGKSTLFNLLLGRHTPSAGSIEHNGLPIAALEPHERARRGIGYKLQVPAVYSGLSVAENAWLAAYARERDARRAAGVAAAALRRVGLDARTGVWAGELSHGEQQWLEIGMVLAGAPGVILLDEPTAGMSHAETLRTVELVQQLAGVATVVVVEHDMEFVALLDAPVAVLHRGRVFATGTYDAIRSDPRVLDIYLGRQAVATP